MSTGSREKGRESENFHMGLKVCVWWWRRGRGFAFLWVFLSLLP